MILAAASGFSRVEYGNALLHQSARELVRLLYVFIDFLCLREQLQGAPEIPLKNPQRGQLV